MTVLELLDELEEIINTAPKFPLTGKVMVDATEILDLSKDIRLSLPDDVQQAKWIRDEKERILSDAKKEYEKIILEAKKQADTMVENDVITQRSVEVANEIYKRADDYSTEMRLRTFDYMNEILGDFRNKIDDVNNTYIAGMFDDINKKMNEMAAKVDGDREQLVNMSDETRNQAPPVHDIEIPVGGGSEGNAETDEVDEA